MPARRSDDARAVDAHVGARLRELRELRGLSQGALAQRLGLKSRQAVAAYEAGDAVSAATLLQLTQVLQVDCHAFFDGLTRPGQLAEEEAPSSLSPQAAKIMALLARAPAAHHPAILSVVRALTQSLPEPDGT